MTYERKIAVAKKEVEEMAPGDGWWKSATPEAIQKALVDSPVEAWPSIRDAVEAMRDEYGD